MFTYVQRLRDLLVLTVFLFHQAIVGVVFFYIQTYGLHPERMCSLTMNTRGGSLCTLGTMRC